MSVVKPIALTDTASGATVHIGEDAIISVVAEGSGSKILYQTVGHKVEDIIVDEAPAAVEAAGASLTTLTELDSGDTAELNVDRIILVHENGSDSTVLYDSCGALKDNIDVDEAPSAIRTAAANMIEVTDRADGATTIQVNINHILRIFDDSASKAVIAVRGLSNREIILKVDEARSAIATAIGLL